MDSWNNEQKPDVSVSGQFSGNPYQDQTQPQNAYDQNACNQLSPNGTGGYNESRSAADQYGGQPGGYNQTQNMAGGPRVKILYYRLGEGLRVSMGGPGKH